MKRVALGFAMFSFALPAIGASTTKTKNSKPKEGQDTAPFKISPGKPNSLVEFTGHLQEIDKNLKSLSGRFEQSVDMADAGLSQKVEGNLEYLKPNRFRLEQDKPERQTVVSDGDKIWVYRPSQNQVIESSLADWKKTDPLLNNLMDFGSYSKMISDYDISYDSSTLRAKLKPKEKNDQPMILTLKLSGPYLFPLETDLEIGQTKIQTVLTHVHFNPKVQESRFRFTPPKGADIFNNSRPAENSTHDRS